MPLGPRPGKATADSDPRARRPAVSRGHTRAYRSGCIDRCLIRCVQQRRGASFAVTCHMLSPEVSRDKSCSIHNRRTFAAIAAFRIACGHSRRRILNRCRGAAVGVAEHPADHRRQPDRPADAGSAGGELGDGRHRRGDRARAAAHGAGHPGQRSRPQHRADRRSRRPDVGLHARHQLEPHQGADRRHRRQRSEQPEPRRSISVSC